MKHIIRLTESDIHRMIIESLDEINHIANTSPVTVCSAEDFQNICANQLHVAPNDSQAITSLYGKYAFIEIGSTKNMDYAMSILSPSKVYPDAKEFYEKGRFYFPFNEETGDTYKNILHLVFDDIDALTTKTVGLNNTQLQNIARRPGNYDPSLAYSRSAINYDDPNNPAYFSGNFDDSKPNYGLNFVWKDLKGKPLVNNDGTPMSIDDINKSGIERKAVGGKLKDLKVAGCKLFDTEMASKTERFIMDNINMNPDVKFIIHCRAGQSRSATIGFYVAKRLEQFTKHTVEEFFNDHEYTSDDGSRYSQFDIGQHSDNSRSRLKKIVRDTLFGKDNPTGMNKKDAESYLDNVITDRGYKFKH